MYKDKSQVDLQTTAPNMAAYFANFAYDSNYLASLLMSTILCVLDVVIIFVSWGPFTKFYNFKSLKEKPLTYDSYGCDQYGNNVNQESCSKREIEEIDEFEQPESCEDPDGNACTVY